jgi:uncharacterized protein YjiS (DUF1127 family)
MYLWTIVSIFGRRPARKASDAESLANMPEHLLYDIGISRDGVPSLARQLRPDGKR